MSKICIGLRNERGESLLSIAAAMVILLVAGLVAAPTIMGSLKSQKANLQGPSFCRDISRNILAQIRSNGIQTKVYRTPAQQNSVQLNDPAWRQNTTASGNINPGGVISEHGIGPALEGTRWPAISAMSWDGTIGKFVPNSPRLLYSAMSLLQAVNNNFGNQACTQPQGILIDSTSGLDPLLPQATLDQYLEAGYFVQASIKTQPFRVADETLLPCNSNLRLRPYGIEEPPMSDTFDLTDNLAGRYQPDLGIKTEVYVTVDHVDQSERNGQYLQNCSSSEKFQFDRVESIIPTPVIDTSVNISLSLSTPVPTPPASGPTPPRRPLTGLFMVCAYEYQFFTLGPAFSHGPVFGNLNTWLPCEQVRVCGGGPPTINEDEFEIEYAFSSAPPNNCSFSVRVTAFDAVGNTLNTPPFTRCFGGTCGSGGATPIASGGGGGGGGNTGYQVAGVTFSSFQTATQAATLTGAPVHTVDLSSLATATMNSNQMSAHSSAVSSVSAASASISSSLGSLGRANVSGADAAVSSAASNVGAAHSAVAAANSMPSSMGAVRDAAVAEAEAALADAEAALAAAEAAKAQAEAEAAADAADDDDGT